MEEAFLQFIWRFQKFNKAELRTSEGELINILKPGIFNTDSGPDFLNAQILLNDILWHGHVEIHTKASDWVLHKHHLNSSYDNVVLHVVFEEDQKIRRTDSSSIPALDLSARVDLDLYKDYKNFISSINILPCNYHLAKVNSSTIISMLDRALVQRLETKAQNIIALLRSNRNDWEETTYQILARNFGFKINSEVFLDLGKALPYKIIKKHAGNLFQIEALLFRMSGLLDADVEDKYVKSLKKEFQFLSHKYSLNGQELGKARWKFLRLRPANFPTLRIAQFASIVAKSGSFFSTLIEATSYKELEKIFESETSDYWKEHYHFNNNTTSTIPGLGQEAIENIIINTICPLLAAYSIEKDSSLFMDKAFQYLESIRAEKNRITKIYTSAGLQIKNSFDSQAVIELFNNYCSQRKCLSCNIGVSIINNFSKEIV